MKRDELVEVEENLTLLRRKSKANSRAPKTNSPRRQLSLLLSATVQSATTMHARVLSSSAGALAATRGAGLAKVCFDVSFFRSRSLRSRELAPFPALHSPCCRGEEEELEEPENLHEKRKGIVVDRRRKLSWPTKLQRRFSFRPRPLPHAPSRSPPPRSPCLLFRVHQSIKKMQKI